MKQRLTVICVRQTADTLSTLNPLSVLKVYSFDGTAASYSGHPFP